MEKLILIDGNAILHRAYHSLPAFKNSHGEVTNAIYGFMRMLIDVYIKIKPDYIGIAWDRKAPTFRHEKYQEYKATRTAPPEDLYPQLPRLKEIIKAFHIPQVEKDGFEADDILGTLAQKAEQQDNLQISILTGDRDALQLVSNKTDLIVPLKGISEIEIYTPAKVKEKYGVTPEQIVDYKALVGDTSDNIPGVQGIGPKNASEMLQKYHTLDGIYENVEELPGKQKDKIVTGKESAYLSQELSAIITTVPVEFNLEDFSIHHIDFTQVQLHFDELEFRSLGKKLDQLRTQISTVNQQSLF